MYIDNNETGTIAEQTLDDSDDLLFETNDVNLFNSNRASDQQHPVRRSNEHILCAHCSARCAKGGWPTMLRKRGGGQPWWGRGREVAHGALAVFLIL